MNRTVLITITAIAAAFLQPFQAYARGGGGGGGHFEGGGNFGSAAHFGGGAGRSTGGWSVRAPQAPAFFAPSVQQSPRVFSQGQAFTRTAPVITNRTFTTVNRGSPTFAFGGTGRLDRNADIQNNQRFNNVTNMRDFARADSRHIRPPAEVSRDWDRRHIHEFNHHHFRFFNNGWVLWDGGYADPYYYDDYGSAPSYDTYDSSWKRPMEYSATDGLAREIQTELVRLGYQPGAIDGVIGSQTRNAIAQFQNNHRLPVTGRIDAALLSALNIN